MKRDFVAHPWTIEPPEIGTHLPGAVMSLTFDPQRIVGMRDARRLHGVVTGILDEPHSPKAPHWSLLVVGPVSPSGWALYAQSDDRVGRLARRSFHVALGRAPAELTFGAAVRLRAPSPTADRTRVVVRTVTPVVVHKSIPSGGRVSYRRPTTRSIHGALGAVARRLGVAVAPEDIVLRVAQANSQATSTLVGKVGTTGIVHGWTGTALVDCNPVARWLLDVAGRIGLGSRTAMGFGRIAVVNAARAEAEGLDVRRPVHLPARLATTAIAEQTLARYLTRIAPQASMLDAIEAVDEIAERATHIDTDGPAEVWRDPVTKLRLVVYHFDDDTRVISSVLGPRGRLTRDDTAPPVSVSPRGAPPTIVDAAPARPPVAHTQPGIHVRSATDRPRNAAPGAAIAWEVKPEAVAAYRDRVERVPEARARAAILWHARRAQPERRDRWRGPLPAGLELRVSEACIVDVHGGPGDG